MFGVFGATGKVGSATAKRLLSAGADVRVIVRREDAVKVWEERGADVRIAPLENHEALSRAIHGCDGLFVLLPFNFEVDDPASYSRQLVDSITHAVHAQKVPHVVMLSSGGADLDQGTGPIVGLHQLEEALRGAGVKLTALRSGHFQEKVTEILDIAHKTGMYPVFAHSADEPIPMVATSDIGVIAAQSLLMPPERSEVVDILGPAYTERHVAEILGRSLNQELRVTVLPEQTWVDTLMAAGLKTGSAQSLAQLYSADARGLLGPRGDKAVQVSTSIESTIDHIVANWNR